MSSRFEAEALLRAAASGAIPDEGDVLVRRREGWVFAPVVGEIPSGTLHFDLIEGEINPGQVPVGVVTQHQAALAITEPQIIDGSILARLAANETIIGTWDFPATGFTIGGDVNLYRPSANLLKTDDSLLVGPDPGGAARLRVGDDTDAPDLSIVRMGGTRPTPTIGDTVRVQMVLANDAGNPVEFAQMRWRAEDLTLGSEDGALVFDVMQGGLLEEAIIFDSSEIVINANQSERDVKIHTLAGPNALTIAGASGRVGIGLPNPAVTLDVLGSFHVSGLVTVDSAVLVANLNADLLDGNHASAFALSAHTHPASEITAGKFGAGAYTFEDGNVTLQSSGTGEGARGITIKSEDNRAFLNLFSDTANTVGEPGGAVIVFHQDGGAVQSIIGTTQQDDQWPNGATLTDVDANSLVLGMNVFNGSINLGIISTLVARFAVSQIDLKANTIVNGFTRASAVEIGTGVAGSPPTDFGRLYVDGGGEELWFLGPGGLSIQIV